MTKEEKILNELHNNLKASKEDILDLIQYLCDLVRYLDRSVGAMNKDFWLDYLEMSYNTVNRIYSSEVRGYFAWRKLQKEFGESEV